MRDRRNILFLASLAILLTLLGMLAESVFFSDLEYRLRAAMFNRRLREKESILGDCLNSMKAITSYRDHHGSTVENNLFSIAETNDITILEYIDDQLIYWSDNGFEVPRVLSDSLYQKPLIFLQNGWFLTSSFSDVNERIIGLLRIHTDYGFQNDLIKSGFVKDFRLPDKTSLSFDRNGPGYPIFNMEGIYLFSLRFPETREHSYFALIPVAIWIVVFILLMILVLDVTKLIAGHGKKLLATGVALTAFTMIYLVLLKFKFPHILFQSELFSPYRFSLNGFAPSLGHLFVMGLLSGFFAYILYLHFPVSLPEGISRVKRYSYLTSMLTGGMALLMSCDMIFRALVSTSNINFETYKILEINGFSIVGFTSVLLMLLVPILFLLKTFRESARFIPHQIIFPALSSMILPVLFYFRQPAVLFPFLVFYILLLLTLWLAVSRRPGYFNLTVFFSIGLGLYSLHVITVLSEKRTTENLKIQAVSLSTENDPEAEHLLIDMWPDMVSDTLLLQRMKAEYFNKIDYDLILRYLQDKYFTGYWHNFTFNIVLCRSDQPLQIDQGSEYSENCFSFFSKRILANGHRLTGTNFYFIDNQAGRSYYLGELFYSRNDGGSNGLFIELYSDINVFQTGYSELLLDKRYHGYAGLKDYSFAKYINGEMVLTTGEFPYDKTDAAYLAGKSDYRIFDAGGYRHVLYKNGNSTVLISRSRFSFEDGIISFAYLFVFILLILNLMLLIARKPYLRSFFYFNFRQKLQLSFISVLMFSFILIGVVVVSFTIRQYHNKHNETLKEKLNSVYIELEDKIGGEEYLSPGWRSRTYSSLDELLIRISNVFKTDVNLFDTKGFLLATSRPEIFFRDLTSQRINNMALINLRELTRSEFFQTEKIGDLEYISAYVPFFNNRNQVIAYLNLPYFRAQNVLAREISNMVVAVINFTLLLIVITMTLAVIISSRLTSPLEMLGEGLTKVGLRRKAEHLYYKGQDEIGELVSRYNRMVDEIEESASKLASSEREYAWREMAKQVAHEIKNPLTPMKLNVQQLLKSWNDKAPGFEDKLEQFSRNQIEQIENLSSIASAFSSFAKMPAAKPAEVNLLDQLRSTVELFRSTAGVTFRVQWPVEERLMIFADKEHLIGIFSNLFKNAIQSIPAGKEGIISIGIEVSNDKVLVSVSDNGTGIPEELQKRLFTPNFTTKSSGMGLGLSIAKKYVEVANGRIWFESDSNNGSVFYVEFPLIYSSDKP